MVKHCMSGALFHVCGDDVSSLWVYLEHRDSAASEALLASFDRVIRSRRVDRYRFRLRYAERVGDALCRCCVKRDKQRHDKHVMFHRPNENKMSDGGRGRASLGVNEWKSSQM